jgi:hypothetical protein
VLASKPLFHPSIRGMLMRLSIPKVLLLLLLLLLMAVMVVMIGK